VSLTQEQKDALHPLLLTKAAASATELPLQPALRLLAQMNEGDTLSTPSLAEEARAILTPEQFTAWEQHADAMLRSSRGMQSQMMAMLPTLLSTLQELVQPAARAH
jgi:hypothetical protein